MEFKVEVFVRGESVGERIFYFPHGEEVVHQEFIGNPGCSQIRVTISRCVCAELSCPVHGKSEG